VKAPRRQGHYGGDNKLGCEWESGEQGVCDGQIIARREQSEELFLDEDNSGGV
jgi:hypothetical protein